MKHILFSIALLISVNAFSQTDSSKLKTSVSLQVRDWLFLNAYLKSSRDFENVYDSFKVKVRIASAPSMTTVIKVDSIRQWQIISLANIIKSASYKSIVIPYSRINAALRATPYLILRIDAMDNNAIIDYNTAIQGELDDLRSVLTQ